MAATLKLISCFAILLLASRSSMAADRELGEYLSGQCTTCHQLSGKTNGIPSIVGWDEASFIVVMNSYKKRERDNKAMQNIASNLSDDDIAALAAYFTTIKPKHE